MYRLRRFRLLNLSVQEIVCASRSISQSSLLMKKKRGNQDDIKVKEKDASKLDIDSLISRIEDKSPETEKSSLESIQTLMKNMKTKKHVLAKQARIGRKVKEVTKMNRERGEEFLFRSADEPIIDKNTSEVTDESLSPHVTMATEKLDVTMASNQTLEEEYEGDIVNDEESFDVEIIDEIETSPVESTILRFEKLKEDLKNEDDRSVSKLMNALIDEIDEDLPNPEDKLKILMGAMNMNMKSQVKPFKEERLPKRRSGKKQYSKGVDFEKGPSTKLFSDYDATEGGHINKKMSLHQINWLKELDNMLPESTPQNSFEVAMLDIDRQWNFPIDNEQDMGVEDETTFEEHVFLDYLLDEFPHKEPIQKFMELVVTGLQQNPYLSVEEKKNRILWFKDYFAKFPDEDLSF